MHSLVTLVNNYYVTTEEDGNQFKIFFQNCNGFVTCKGRSEYLIYITFLHFRFSSVRQYTEEFDPKIFYFQWPARTKMQRMYQKLSKEENYNHKFLRCPYLRVNNFEVLRLAIALNKDELECA